MSIIALCSFLKEQLKADSSNPDLIKLANSLTAVIDGSHLSVYQDYSRYPKPCLEKLKILDFCKLLRQNKVHGLSFEDQQQDEICEDPQVAVMYHTNRIIFKKSTIPKTFITKARRAITTKNFTPHLKGTVNTKSLHKCGISFDAFKNIQEFHAGSYLLYWKNDGKIPTLSQMEDSEEEREQEEVSQANEENESDEENDEENNEENDEEEETDQEPVNNYDQILLGGGMNLLDVDLKEKSIILEENLLSSNRRSSQLVSSFTNENSRRHHEIIDSQMTVSEYTHQLNIRRYESYTPQKSQQKISEQMLQNKKDHHKDSLQDCLKNPFSFQDLLNQVEEKLQGYRDNFTESQIKGWWVFTLFQINADHQCDNKSLKIQLIEPDTIQEERRISCIQIREIMKAEGKAKEQKLQEAQQQPAQQEMQQQLNNKHLPDISHLSKGKGNSKMKHDISTIYQKIRENKQCYEEKPIKSLSSKSSVYKETDVAAYTKNLKKGQLKELHKEFKTIVTNRDYIDPVYIRFNLVSYPAPNFTPSEFTTLNRMMNSAVLINRYVESKLSPEQKKLFTGSPFFDSQNYRLMNSCHAYQVTKGTNKFRHFQHRNYKQAFNNNFVFRPDIQKQEPLDEYFDQLMGVANILCDGMIYVERRAFLMLLAGLLNAPPSHITDSHFLNPLSFPFAAMMNILVFDFRLSQYQIRLVHRIDNKPHNLNQVPAFTKIFDENKKLISEWVDGYSSIIVELCYFNKDEDIPKAQYVVIRENQCNYLEAMSMKRGVIALPQWYYPQFNEKKLVSNLIDELFCSDEFKLGLKLPLSLRFYECSRLSKPRFTLTHRPADFMPRARDALVRYFSMYGAKEFPYCELDLRRGEKYLIHQIDELTYEKAESITYYAKGRDNYDYIYPDITSWQTKDHIVKLRKRIQKDNEKYDLESNQNELNYYEKDNENLDPWYCIQTVNHFAEIISHIENSRDEYNSLEFDHYIQFYKDIQAKVFQKIQNKIPEILNFMSDKGSVSLVPLQEKQKNFQLNYEIPYDLRVNMINCLTSTEFPRNKYEQANLVKLRRYDDKLSNKYLDSIQPIVEKSHEFDTVKTYPASSKIIVPDHLFNYQNVYKACFFKSLAYLSQQSADILKKTYPVNSEYMVVPQNPYYQGSAHLQNLYNDKLFHQNQINSSPNYNAPLSQSPYLQLQNDRYSKSKSGDVLESIQDFDLRGSRTSQNFYDYNRRETKLNDKEKGQRNRQGFDLNMNNGDRLRQNFSRKNLLKKPQDMKNVKANVLQQYGEEKGDHTGKRNKSRQDDISRGGLIDPASHRGSVGHTKSVNANKRLHDSELEILSQQSQKQQNVNNQLKSSAEQINQHLQNSSDKNSTSKNGQNTQHSNGAKPIKQQIQSSSNSSTGSVNRSTHKPSSQTTKKAPARESKEPGLNIIPEEDFEETQTQTVPNKIINEEDISESDDEDKGTHPNQTAKVNPAINKSTEENKKKNEKPRVSNKKEPKQKTLQDTIEKFDKNNKNSQKPKKPNAHATKQTDNSQVKDNQRISRSKQKELNVKAQEQLQDQDQNADDSTNHSAKSGKQLQIKQQIEQKNGTQHPTTKKNLK